VLESWARQAQTHGWARTADRFTGNRPALAQYVFDPRNADWRFLLPAPPRGDVLLAGGALSCAPLVLAETARQVSVLTSPPEQAILMSRAAAEGCANVAPARHDAASCALYDLVGVMRPAPGRSLPGRPLRLLPVVARHVMPGGHLYLEVDLPSALVPPVMVRSFLRGRGFDRVTFYWPRPGFPGCEMYMQMGDRRLQRYYLEQMFFGTSALRRLVRAALRAASALGVFELSLPGYIVIARRRAARQTS
jgi:hypothetical protein